MAAGVYPKKPGTNYGPCLKPCKHRDCASMRKDAQSLCRICGKVIGYEHLVYFEPPTNGSSGIVHAVCLEKSLEGKLE